MADIAERLQTHPQEAAGLNAADIEAIRAYLAPRLDRLEEGLGAAVCGYVLLGDSDSVLARLPTLRSVPRFHNTLSSLLGYEAEPDVRRVFLEAQSWDPAVVRRLGNVLVAAGRCGGYASRWPGSASSPDYLRALVHVSVTLLQERSVHSACWLLNGLRCLELLSVEGGDQAQLVDTVFASHNRDYYRQGRRRLLAMHGLAQVLAAAPARTLHGARALDDNGKRSFVTYLGQAELVACPQFADYLLDTLAHAGALQSDAALYALASCDRDQQLEFAARLLASDGAARRIAAARLLPLTASRAARSLLAQHLEAEKVLRVQEHMRQALWELDVLTDEAQRAAADGGQGYVALDGRWIALPPVPPLPPGGELPEGLAQGLRDAANKANGEAGRELRAVGWRDAQGSEIHGDYELYSAAASEELVEALKGGVLPAAASDAARGLAGREPRQALLGEVIGRYYSRLYKLLSQPEITPQHLALALALEQGGQTPVTGGGARNWAHLLVHRESRSVSARLLRDHALRLGDLRTVLLATAPLGSSAEVIGELLRTQPPGWARMLREAPGPLLWPLVAEHLAILDQALGLAPETLQGPLQGGARRLTPLVLLSRLPAPPRRYLPVLLELAVKGRAEERPLARHLLAGAPDLQEPLAALLKSGDRDRRSGVAAWLGERGDRSAIPWLRAALEVERIDTVRAAQFAALVVLGDDLSDLLSEQRLLQEARTGLSRMRSRVGRCVPLEHLPQLRWADGSAVPAELVRWCIVLADRLQQPGGNAFLDLLLQRLAADSAEQLGQLVLSSFAVYDTHHPSEAEANAYAQAEADRWVQKVRPHTGQLAGEALRQFREQMFARAKREKLQECLEDAYPHRGILALAQRVRPSTVVSAVSTYLRDNPRRTPQCRALLDMLAHHGSPLALQLLFGIARAYRRRYQREHADALLDNLARQGGWSRQELAERTIPTGGLAEGGTLALESKGGAYTVRLDADLQLVLRNPQGRMVKTLPAAHAGRKALIELKKELKQTLAQQTVRLHEAMCLARQWRPEELEILLRHPIAGRLCERLIFAGLDSQGQLLAAFRPLGDGTLSDAADASVDLAAFTHIRLAHRAMLDEEQVQAWQQHLQDYRIQRLFEQLMRPLLKVDDDLGHEREITEREGYMLDTASLRTEAVRLGYQRGKMRHDHTFTVYEKPFSAAGLTAIIEFTGSAVPERNMPCALVALRVAGRDSYWDQQGVPLSSVPGLLLSEVWNDLREIAASGSGFDPMWRSRVRGVCYT